MSATFSGWKILHSWKRFIRLQHFREFAVQQILENFALISGWSKRNFIKFHVHSKKLYIEEVTIFFSCLYNNERPLVVNVGGSSGSKYSKYIPEQVWEVKYLVQCQL